MTYAEFREQEQKLVNELPLFFAFSDKQFNEALEERHVTEEDIYSLKGWGGAFYLKSDAEKIYAYFNREDPIKPYLSDHKFMAEAFLYELKNHEYCYNTYQGDWDTLTAIFGNMPYHDTDTYQEYLQYLGHPELIPIYENAVTEYYDWCDEHDVW